MFVRKLFVHVRRQVSERVLRTELAAKSTGGVPAKPGVGCPQNQGAGAHKTGDEVPAKPGDRSRSFIRWKKPPL